MSTYFTTHPNLSVTALVTAPTTEKARTTFLDYLERRGAIARADRSYWRRNMVAERMDNPEDVQADVELYYGYQEGGQQMPPSMAATPQRYTDEERQTYYDRDEIPPTDEMMTKDLPPMSQDSIDYAMEHNVEQVPQEVPAPRGLSPIQQISLGRKS